MSFTAVAVGVGSAVAGAAVSSALAPSPSGAGGAAGAADPFASQRPQYQSMLQAMVTGKNADGTPYSFQDQDPSAQFRFDQGVKATNQGAAKSGLLNSGERLLELQSFGQNFASTEYSNQFNRLSQLAGANVGSPAAAGQILYNQGQQQQAGASAVGNAVGGAVGQGIQGFFNQPSAGANGQQFAPSFGGDNQFGFTSGVSDPSGGVSYGFGGFGG